MPDKSNEERAADRVLGFHDAAEGRPAPPEGTPGAAESRLEAEMLVTISALKEWRRQLEAPPVRVPAPGPSFSCAWPGGIAAALAIGFGFNFWAMNHGNTETIARELEWTSPAPPAPTPGPAREITLHYAPPVPGAEALTGALVASRGWPAANPRIGSNSASAQDVRRLAAFPFRMPDRLPGSLTLRAAEAVGSNRVRLVYAGDSGTMAVFLSRSPGPDIAPRPVTIGERTLIAGRRHGVLAAFDAAPGPSRDWNALLLDFAGNTHAGG